MPPAPISSIAALPPLPALGPDDARTLPPLRVLEAEAGAGLVNMEEALRAAGASSDRDEPVAARVRSAEAEADALPGAMRLDQSTLRQLAWRVPDTARLAPAWRSTLLRTADPGSMQSDHGRGLPLAAEASAAAPVPAQAAPAAVPRPALSLALPLPGWVNVYAWGGMQAMLGVFALDPEEEPPHRRRTPVPALRFALEIPGLGRIHARMHLAEGGVMMELGAQSPALMQHLRDCLPAIATAMARAELRLLRCRLRDLAGLEREGHIACGLPASLALSPALFRAATELWAVLAPPLVAAAFQPSVPMMAMSRCSGTSL